MKVAEDATTKRVRIPGLMHPMAISWLLLVGQARRSSSPRGALIRKSSKEAGQIGKAWTSQAFPP